MNFVVNTINDARVARAGREHARMGLEPAHDRLLEGILGPTVATPDDDLVVRRARSAAQRSREEIEDTEASVALDPRREAPNPAKVSPHVYLALFVACAVTDFVGSEVTAYFAGVPARQRVFVAASFTIGALLTTMGMGTAIERAWRRGVLGRLGALVLGAVYVLAILLISASRFAPVDEEVSLLEVVGGGLMTLFGVGGPALGAHFALRAWFKARPAALAERAAATSRRRNERELERAHGVLVRAQREGRERETERARLRAVYLTAFREEAARLAKLDSTRKQTANQEN